MIKSLAEGLLALLMSPHEGQRGSSTMAQAITLLLGYFTAHFSLFHFVGNGSKIHHLSCVDSVESYSVDAKVLHSYVTSSMILLVYILVMF